MPQQKRAQHNDNKEEAGYSACFHKLILVNKLDSVAEVVLVYPYLYRAKRAIGGILLVDQNCSYMVLVKHLFDDLGLVKVGRGINFNPVLLHLILRRWFFVEVDITVHIH